MRWCTHGSNRRSGSDSLLHRPTPVTGIRHLSGLTRLKVLNLWNCLRVTHQGLAHLRALPVVELSLRGCLVDDSACPALAKLGNLVRLDMRACERLTGRYVLRPMGSNGSIFSLEER